MANIIQRPSYLNDAEGFHPLMEVSDWFNHFGMRPFFRNMETAPQIKMNLTESEKSYLVHAEVPGVNKDDIKVTVDGNRVSISAEVKQEKEEKKGDKVLRRECYQGSNYRSFTLASNIDEGKVQAKYTNGILELILPKKNGSAQKEIAIS
ncbi:MAG: Hsp20/alpha crystallin family protein [Pseudomonadota bacterium]